MASITFSTPRPDSCPPQMRLQSSPTPLVTTFAQRSNSSLAFDFKLQQLRIHYPSPSSPTSPAQTPSLTPIVDFLDEYSGRPMTSGDIQQIHSTTQGYFDSTTSSSPPLANRLSLISGTSEKFLNILSTNFNYMSALSKESQQSVYCPQSLGTIARDLATSKVIDQQILFDNPGDTLTYVKHQNNHSYIQKARSKSPPSLLPNLACGFNEAHTCEQRNLFLIPPHENIISFYGLAPQIDLSSNLYPLLLEYAPKGALWESLPKLHLSPKHLLILAQQIAKGVLHLHSHGILYLDLKQENIVIDAKGNARIIDFGGSYLIPLEAKKKVFEENESIQLPKRGTANYYPPEFFLQMDEPVPTSSKTDVWAFGHILYEMLDRDHDLLYYLRSVLDPPDPENKKTISEVLKIFFREHPEPQKFIHACVDQAQTSRISDLGEIAHLLGKIAKECLDLDFTKRPDMQTIVKNLSSMN